MVVVGLALSGIEAKEVSSRSFTLLENNRELDTKEEEMEGEWGEKGNGAADRPVSPPPPSFVCEVGEVKRFTLSPFVGERSPTPGSKQASWSSCSATVPTAVVSCVLW